MLALRAGLFMWRLAPRSPIFSTALRDRQFAGSTRKTTLGTNWNAWSSISRFSSPLYRPPQCERARNVQPISISP